MNNSQQNSEEKIKLEYLAKVETNLVFIFFDILEQLWIKTENINQRCGYVFKNEEKRYYNAIKHNLQCFRRASRQLDIEDQIQYGNDAEITLDIIYAAVSRTGSDNMILTKT